MTTRKKESTNKISRRRFIQTVAAGTVAASTNGLAAIAAPLEGTGLDDSPDTNDIFPILALWLAVTTNEAFTTLSPGTLAGVTQRSGPEAQKAISRAQVEKKDLYKQIRAEFQKFRGDLGYSGTQCPRKLDTLKIVSQTKLPQ